MIVASGISYTPVLLVINESVETYRAHSQTRPVYEKTGYYYLLGMPTISLGTQITGNHRIDNSYKLLCLDMP